MIARTLQDLFVDRQREIDRFLKSLRGDTVRRIVVITAGPGMGKSWLLKQFAVEARNRGALSVLLDFADGQAYDALMLMRRFRDALDSPSFNRLTQEINAATMPQVVLNGGPERADVRVSLGSHNQVGDVQVGDVAGGNIVKDNLFVVQTDNPLILQTIEDRITTVFFECLRELLREQRVVFLFDSYERLSLDSERWVASEADRWLMRELLRRVRDGQLGNVLVVIAGRRVPEFDVEWNEVLGRMALERFEKVDVAHYLRENRNLTLSDAEVDTLYNAVQGHPQLLGIVGDNLEQAARPLADDDW